MSYPRPATAVSVATCALAAGLIGGAIALPAEYAAARAPLARAADATTPAESAKTSSASESPEEFEGLFAEGEGDEEEVAEGTATAGPTGTSASAGGVSGEGAAGNRGSTSEADAHVSSLKLVRASASALSHHAVRASEIRFAFTLSTSVRVRVQLARASSRAGEVRWRVLPDTVTLTGLQGLNRARLHAANALPAGEYRLTVAAARGSARSILIRVS
jgi:hypothetical protein